MKFLKVNKLFFKKKDTAKCKISLREILLVEIYLGILLWKILAVEFMYQIVVKNESFTDAERLRLTNRGRKRRTVVSSVPCFINVSSESASLWSLPRAYPTLSASLLAVWLFAKRHSPSGIWRSLSERDSRDKKNLSSSEKKFKIERKRKNVKHRKITKALTI